MRRVRDEYVGRYRRAASARVVQHGGRGAARPENAGAESLRAAAPQVPVRWVTGPIKPATLATTRLAEDGVPGLDIAEPLGIDFPDTNRLQNIALASAPGTAVRILAGRRGATRGALLADGTGRV